MNIKIATCCFLYAYLSAGFLSAQSRLDIQLLNAKNGKPLKGERVLLFWGSTENAALEHREHIDTYTKKDGVAILEAIPANIKWLQVWSDGNVICQKNSDKAFERKQIQSSGIVEPDTCGFVKVEATPNRLTLFVRPYSFWEKMGQ